jgi:hypothetical protein
MAEQYDQDMLILVAVAVLQGFYIVRQLHHCVAHTGWCTATYVAAVISNFRPAVATQDCSAAYGTALY